MAAQKQSRFHSQPQAVYKKTGITTASGLNLRSSEWMVLTQVNGEQTIQEIAHVAALDLKNVTQIMYNLFQLNLIEIFQDEKKVQNTLAPSFFENMEQVLTEIIGPVAPFVIEDVLSDHNLKKDNFPSQNVAELIEHICDEIQDDEKKITFQSNMLVFIKKELM